MKKMADLKQVRLRPGLRERYGKWRDGAPTILFRPDHDYYVEDKYLDDDVFVVVGEKEEPTSEPEEQGGDVPAYSLPVSESDFLKDELVAIAEDLGVSTDGTKADLVSAINATQEE